MKKLHSAQLFGDAVVLSRDGLNPDSEADELRSLWRPDPAELMRAYPVRKGGTVLVMMLPNVW